MAKAKTPWLDLDTDPLPVIRFVLEELDGDGRMRPITLTALKVAKKVLGIRLQPANKDGLRNWWLPPGKRARLADYGIDPATGRLVDLAKWREGQARLKQEKTEKQILEEQIKTRESIREATKKYMPPPPPSPTQFVANHAAVNGIAKHLRKAQCEIEEEGPFPTQKPVQTKAVPRTLSEAMKHQEEQRRRKVEAHKPVEMSLEEWNRLPNA